jgi:protoporphyrinogen oxidase
MIPQGGKSCLGMEYFCNEDGELWGLDDKSLVRLAAAEIEKLGLAPRKSVKDGCVIRQKKAYPVYDEHYRGHLEVIRAWLEGFENLHTIGRNGMHRYNNQDHSMLTGLLAARNVMGEKHDLWDVNTERSYYEEQVVSKKDIAAAAAAREDEKLVAAGDATTPKE